MKQKKQEKQYIQIGFTATREPGTGRFLPAVPLYIEATDAAEASAEGLIEDIGHLLALRMKTYIEENKKAGLPL